MIPRKRLTLIFGALLAFTVQCSLQAVADKEEKSLGVVRFPAPWSKTTVDGATVALANRDGLVARENP